MYYNPLPAKRFLKVTYLLYDRITGTFGQPVTITFYSNSKNPRNLNDIAARYARVHGIKWDKLIVRAVLGDKLSERTRMYYNFK